MGDVRDQEIDDITDSFISFLHDIKADAKELCRALKKKLQTKK